MKLSKIKALCLDSRRCVLARASDGALWIGDGRHYYRLIGIEVESDAVDDLLGINPKQGDKMAHLGENRREAFFRREGPVIGDALVFRGAVIGYGVHVWVLDGDAGAVYVAEDAVLASRVEDNLANFVLVHDGDGEPLVAVMRGLFCDALLKPAAPEAAEAIREGLDAIARIPVRGLAAGNAGAEAM